jgi:hypothetical protein
MYRVFNSSYRELNSVFGVVDQLPHGTPEFDKNACDHPTTCRVGSPCKKIINWKEFGKHLVYKQHMYSIQQYL